MVTLWYRRAPLAEDGGLADDSARGVVDEAVAADLRAGVDVRRRSRCGRARRARRA